MSPFPNERDVTLSHDALMADEAQAQPLQGGDAVFPQQSGAGHSASLAHPPRASLSARFLDRDHSILAFNERVFDWAARADVPLLERLRYLSIVSSNLDEFFEVRAEPHITAARNGETKGPYSAASFEALSAKAHDLVERQYALYNEVLVPALMNEGIRIIPHGERNAAQRRWVGEYFAREVQPLLVPVGLDPAHPTEFSQFRVTRHSDLAVDEEDVRNLRMVLRQGLQQRNFGQAVRLEVSSGCSKYLSDFLLRQFDLPPAALYRVHGPVNLVRLAQLVDLVADPKLLFPGWRPTWPRQIPAGTSIMAQMRQRDVLIHHPFESFDGVLAFLREAVHDPQVVAIKQTIYRTGSDPELMELLREAVRRGKEVMAVVELKARFDEEANINWAEALESVGAQVVFGVVGLKTHAKMLLVTRKEGRQLRRYGHLSTGNYNPRTARLYTDLSYLTADEETTADMDSVFNHLASQNRLPRMRRLLVAPFHLHRRMLEKIEQVGLAAARGEGGRIVAKMNALTDEALTRALVVAAQRGARIDLIVRGACILPAQLPGLTENIRVRSIIGRFLEHSRVFYFRCGAEEELFLSSADWMNRNMMRRVEVSWPVTDPELRQRIIDECLLAYLHDDRDAWELQPEGYYVRAERYTTGHGAQNALTLRYGPSVAGARGG